MTGISPNEKWRIKRLLAPPSNPAPHHNTSSMGTKTPDVRGIPPVPAVPVDLCFFCETHVDHCYLDAIDTRPCSGRVDEVKTPPGGRPPTPDDDESGAQTTLRGTLVR